MFGGPDLKTLFFTSACVELGWSALKVGPLAGSLFAIATDVAGIPETPFAGQSRVSPISTMMSHYLAKGSVGRVPHQSQGDLAKLVEVQMRRWQIGRGSHDGTPKAKAGHAHNNTQERATRAHSFPR